MHLPHHRRQPLAPAVVVLAELAVAVAPGIRLQVLLPQQAQRHPGPSQLGVHQRGVHRGSVVLSFGLHPEDPGLERLVRGQFLRYRPAHPRRPGQPEVLRHRPCPGFHGGRHGSLGQSAPQLQPQDLSQLSHRQSFRRQGVPLCGGSSTPRYLDRPVLTIPGIGAHHPGIHAHHGRNQRSPSRNRRSPCSGNRAHLRPESVLTMVRSRQQLRMMPEEDAPVRGNEGPWAASSVWCNRRRRPPLNQAVGPSAAGAARAPRPRARRARRLGHRPERPAHLVPRGGSGPDRRPRSSSPRRAASR